MRLTMSGGLTIKVLGTAGLLGLALLTCQDPLKTTGRRLFAHPLEEEIFPTDPSMASYGSYGTYGSSYGSMGSFGTDGSYGSHYKVEQLIAPHDLLKLFKTAAGSPQDALQRMSLSGAPSEAEWTSALQDWNWGLGRREISSIFHGIDVDGDGKVTLPELLSCFRHGYQGTVSQSQVPAAPSPSPRYDCRDGLDVWRLDWSQAKIQSCSLISVMELRQHMRPHVSAAEMVQAADLDGDGAISQAEWTQAATRGSDPFVKSITEPRAEFAFKSMDVSQDGTLSKNDLLSALDLAGTGLAAPWMSAHTPTLAHTAVAGPIDAKTLKQRLLVKWATLSNAFDKMDLDGNHRLSREEWSSGLAELDPPLDAGSASYLFEGVDALRDGHLTPPELQGTLDIGQLFQTQEALRKVLHWDKATMDRHAKVSSWIHDAKPNWQHDQRLASAGPKGHKKAEASQKLPLVQSMRGAFLSASDAFQNIDQDHSDDASMAEFQQGLARFQPPITGVLAEEAFHNLDRDGNGKVSRAEFAALDARMPTGGSLDKNMKDLMSKAEEEFRMQASKWAGSMKNACAQMGTQVSFPHFRSSIRNFEPLLSAEAAQAIFNEMDSDHDGFLDPEECHMSLDHFKGKLKETSSLRNMFVTADRNNDHQLSREEFADFGQMLDKSSSKGKYAVFFEDELDTDHDGRVGLPSLETVLGEKEGTKLHDDDLSAGDLSSYDLPAIMHGKCIFTALDAQVSPGLRDKVGKAFAAALGTELSVQVHIVGVQEIAHPTMGRGKEFDLLYTSKTASGAAAIRKLHDQARQIQATVQEAIRKVTSAGTSQAWCSSTLDFYGPQAGKLPKGSKIKEVFGELPLGHSE